MSEYLAGRQPIFDAHRRLVAHELLFRSGDRNEAAFADPGQAESASAALLTALLGGPGLEFISAGKQVFVNCTEHMLVSGMLLALPREQVVVEVLETVPASSAVLEALATLRAAGFRVALDDWLDETGRSALLSVADVVKIEAGAVRGGARLQRDITALRARGLEVLVEKIETDAEFRLAAETGATLFQGYLLARPEVLRHRSLDGNAAVAMRALGLISSERSTLRDLDEIISADPAMALRVLRLASSAALSRGRRFGTLRQAILHLGFERVRQLAMLVVLARQPAANEHQVRVSLTRARMCELVANEQHMEAKEAFVVGLLSNLDSLLGLPLAKCLAGLELSGGVRDALFDRGRPSGLGYPLGIAIAFESRERMAALSRQEALRWQHAYLAAAGWADRLVDVLLEHPAPPGQGQAMAAG